MKRLALLLSIFTFFILGGQNVYACSCDEVKASEIESMSEADFSQWLKSFNGAVFLGRAIKKVKARSDFAAVTKVTFEVETYWKGANTKRIVIYTAANEGACGVSYSRGENYLIVASNYKGKLRTGLCQHLKYNDHREIFLRKLGEGKKPIS